MLQACRSKGIDAECMYGKKTIEFAVA